jgi:thiamine transport system substrate-binding protein
MWGVDNTLLSAAQDGTVFEGEPTQVDFGDVCINYDIAYFDGKGVQPPVTLDDLRKPEYEDLLVVEDPSSSSPGLAFLLATVAEFGDDGWQQYWTDLRANGVEVVDSWETAYYEKFSGAGGSTGEKPLVVSYASSPPAEVLFADPPVDTAPTGVSEGTCFRQMEYAGVLRGTQHLDEAKQLVQFLTSTTFQQELPLALFVYPVDPATPLPEAFTKYSVVVADPYTMDPARIAANRQQWQEQWTQLLLG